MNEGVHKLNLKSDGAMLGISTAAWQSALKRCEADPGAQIRHAPIAGTAAYRTHVAEIGESVTCHFHQRGDEDYAILSGRGRLHWGAVVKTADGAFDVAWEAPLSVASGDSFRIPAGYAHQLENLGRDAMVILFGCPDSHIDDCADRIMLPTAPELVRARSVFDSGVQP